MNAWKKDSNSWEKFNEYKSNQLKSQWVYHSRLITAKIAELHYLFFEVEFQCYRNGQCVDSIRMRFADSEYDLLNCYFMVLNWFSVRTIYWSISEEMLLQPTYALVWMNSQNASRASTSIPQMWWRKFEKIFVMLQRNGQTESWNTTHLGVSICLIILFIGLFYFIELALLVISL